MPGAVLALTSAKLTCEPVVAFGFEIVVLSFGIVEVVNTNHEYQSEKDFCHVSIAHNTLGKVGRKV